MVLEACPDITDYTRGGIGNWRDFVAAAGLVRSVLGISPSAYDDAVAILGPEDSRSSSPPSCSAARRSEARAAICANLVDKAKAGQFSLGPVLMALIRARGREKLRA